MRKPIPGLFFCFCFLIGLSWQSVRADINTIDTIDIRILPESVAYNDYYTLGEIAEMDGFDIETIQKLANLQIGKSPLPGRSLVISHGNVRRQIKAFDSSREFNLHMPSKPVVSRASTKVDRDQLHDLVYQEIKSHYQDYEQVKIAINTKLSDVYLPKGDASYEVNRIGKAIQIGGNSTWTLKLLVDGNEIRKMFVRAKVQVFDEVLVAKNEIDKGATIEETDLKAMTKNISRERIGYQTEPDLLVGQQAKRPIQKNESLRDTLVEEPVLIKKGAPVKLIYKTKNLLLTNLVKALKEGKKGDVIPVRPLTGNRTIYAVVIDENSVEVAL